VRQRPATFQYRPQRLLEFRPGRSCRHVSRQPYTPGNSPELFPVASRHADRGVDQFVAKDRCDLHRHHVFRLAQVGPDKDLKMPILTALIIAALADVPAAPVARRESNRNTQLRW
jgi:hypothetical protein